MVRPIRLHMTVLCMFLLGCSGQRNCEPSTEDFSLEEELTEDEWTQIEEFWGATETEDHYCRWACEQVYQRTRTWEVSLLADCFLDVAVAEDTGSGGTVTPLGAIVSCEGTGAEYLCESD